MIKSDWFRIIMGLFALLSIAIYEYNVDKEERQCRIWLKSAIQHCNANSYWSKEEISITSQILANSWRIWKVHPVKALGHWMHESNLRWYATGINIGTVDIGIAQINSNTDNWLRQSCISYCNSIKDYDMVRKLRSRNAYDIETSAYMSLYYMSLLNKHGKKMSIVAYNAGSPHYLSGIFKKYYIAVRKQIEKLESWDNI